MMNRVEAAAGGRGRGRWRCSDVGDSVDLGLLMALCPVVGRMQVNGSRR